MAAADLKPTRMEAAKAAARDFVQRQPPTVQIGVVAFSDSGFSVQTADQRPGCAPGRHQPPDAPARHLAGQRHPGFAQCHRRPTQPGQGPADLQQPDARPHPTPTPVPKGTYTNRGDRPADRRRKQRSARPAGRRPDRRRPRGAHLYGGHRQRQRAPTCTSTASPSIPSWMKPPCSKSRRSPAGPITTPRAHRNWSTIYDNLDPQLIIKPEKTEVTSLFAGASILVLLIGGVFSLLWFSRLP